jgi:hypothetical protein
MEHAYAKAGPPCMKLAAPLLQYRDGTHNQDRSTRPPKAACLMIIHMLVNNGTRVYDMFYSKSQRYHIIV